MAAELGQTSDPRALIPGEPAAIARDLRQLAGTIGHVGTVGANLATIDPATWTGDGATAFRTSFGAQPPQWTGAADTLGRGAQALADYGDVLVWGQREAQRAIEMYTQAQAASRVAATAKPAAGKPADPGQGAEQEAHAVLAHARGKVDEAGNDLAQALSFEADGKGGFTAKFGKGEFGAAEREKVDGVDLGGWQHGKHGRSFQGEFGSQGPLLTDELDKTLKGFGVPLPSKTWSPSAGTDVLHQGLDGKFKDGPLSGDGDISGSLFGADAEAHATADPLGVTAGASAEAYVAKGDADGEADLGGYGEAKGNAEVMLDGTSANADATVGPLGGQVDLGAFVGDKASVSGSVDAGGVTGGANGEAWYGDGVEAGGEMGMGADGKFHVGASLGAALGVGGKFGFEVTVDPGQVVGTVKDVGGDAVDVAKGGAKEVSHVATSIWHHL